MRPSTRWLTGWLLAASFVLPQTTCTLDVPSGSTIVVDPGAALIAADLFRDIVFIRNVDDDYFDDDHHYHHGFFDWWY